MTNSFMAEAIALSLENIRSGKGGPFAVVVVRNGKIIARGTNQVTSTNDPTAHAEIVAIRQACQELNDFQLTGCDFYTTCEPCPMCLGAIYWARPDRVFFGNTREDAANIDFDDAFIYDELVLPLSERKIQMFPCMREEAQVAFQEWQNKTDKVAY